MWEYRSLYFTNRESLHKQLPLTEPLSENMSFATGWFGSNIYSFYWGGGGKNSIALPLVLFILKLQIRESFSVADKNDICLRSLEICVGMTNQKWQNLDMIRWINIAICQRAWLKLFRCWKRSGEHWFYFCKLKLSSSYLSALVLSKDLLLLRIPLTCLCQVLHWSSSLLTAPWWHGLARLQQSKEQSYPCKLAFVSCPKPFIKILLQMVYLIWNMIC